MPNRLARESSPYLLLHAENPVDWYAWGDEAFEKARSEDKPLFLSVGYSTCYWCHVMERECFSDPEIARQLNEGFVSVKLDREERPDLDEIYMTATQLLTRSGGWPNSLFLTHELEPFFAGTYFPPEDRHGRAGFPRVLAALRDAWETRRDDVLEQARAVSQAIREQLGSNAASAQRPQREAVAAARQGLARRFDRKWGGFGGAPKFPSPSNLFFLLDLAGAGDAEAGEMLVVTLDHMARGGIHDQVGGGFHRYSTDAEWLVPHFEKMLYDNAALGVLYAEAALLAPAAGFEDVARRTLGFVLEELMGSHGGFLSAIDAETDGDEGAYYAWTAEELRAVLDPEQQALLARVYGFEGAPNFEGDRYVLHLPRALPEWASASAISVAELLRRVEPGRRALLAARWRRKRPLLDDKVLADWNGLMIAGLSRAGTLLEEPRYVEAAARAARFVLAELVDPASGTLLHVYRDGRARVPAFLDDYAFLVQGLLALHAATGDEAWRREAMRLAAEQDRRLWDEPHGGYFAAGEDPRLLLRSRSATDGAVASGNGVSALNLLELARQTGEAVYAERAERLLRAFGAAVSQWPLAHVTLVRAALRLAQAAGEPVASASERLTAGRSLEEVARAVVQVRGAVRADSVGPWRPFVLDIEIQEGWHLNANPASQDMLVATEVRGDEGALRRLKYPEAEELRPAFAAGSIQIYRGRVRIDGEVQAGNGEPSCVTLVYQACDDSRCLPPVAREVPLA